MSDMIQLTNGTLWNGNSINGNFDHISVIEFTISWDPIH